MKADNTRIFYLDLLRIFATVSVICLHVASTNWDVADIHSFEWNVNLVYNSFVRFSVPIFLMISGVLFLNPIKEIDINELYSKKIVRIITAFAFWSFIYLLVELKQYAGIKWALREFIYGHYHLWYLYMIIGIYVIVPLLRQIIKEKKYIEYFLVITFVFTFLIPTITSFFPFLEIVYSRMYFHFTMGYTGYFVIGMYLSEIDISPKTEKIIYLLGIIGFLTTIVVSVLVTQRSGQPYGYWEGASINVLCVVIAVFVLFKYRISRIRLSEKAQNYVVKLSQYSFGIYLVHAFVLERINEAGLSTSTFNPIVAVPVIVLLVFLISAVVSGILNHIPVMNKYIV